MSWWRRRQGQMPPRSRVDLPVKPYLASAIDSVRDETAERVAAFADFDLTNDGDLLIACDSLLSLLRHRQPGLTDANRRDLDELLPKLRTRTDAIIRRRRERPPSGKPLPK